MTKQEEINVLQSLKGDTYFNQYFTNHDIDQMCENIKNDFAIESGCRFYEEESKLRNEIRLMENQHQAEMSDLCEKILESIDNGCDEDEVYEVVKDTIGINEIIKYKHKNAMDLNDEELDYLVSLI